MAVSRRAWSVLTYLDFQACCEFDTPEGERCTRFATYALFRVPCNCEGLQRVQLACIQCKKWMWHLKDARCADCDFEFEPTGAAAFDQVQRLAMRG